MKKDIALIAKLPDLVLSRLYLSLFQEKNSLMIFVFHGLFLNEKEITLNLVDPKLGTTIDSFCQFVEYFLNHDYTFISPNDVLNGLNIDKKYVMLTFDDGYFNNQRALPILKKYQIPAVFFVSPKYIKDNKCFWWDVLYRERIKSDISIKDITLEQQQLKSKTNEEIEKYIVDIFGKKAFEPVSDVDRPFTPSELKDFSEEKYVFLGNHTSDHAILTNYSSKAIKSKILNAQHTIHDITGLTPIIISYPNGNYSNEIIRISKKNGLKLGVTTNFKKNHLPIDPKNNDRMILGRFDLSGNKNVIKECELFRSDVVIYTRILNLLKKRY